jgi:hypothetical protein
MSSRSRPLTCARGLVLLRPFSWSISVYRHPCARKSEGDWDSHRRRRAGAGVQPSKAPGENARDGRKFASALVLPSSSRDASARIFVPPSAPFSLRTRITLPFSSSSQLRKYESEGAGFFFVRRVDTRCHYARAHEVQNPGAGRPAHPSGPPCAGVCTGSRPAPPTALRPRARVRLTHPAAMRQDPGYS